MASGRRIAKKRESRRIGAEHERQDCIMESVVEMFDDATPDQREEMFRLVWERWATERQRKRQALN